MHYLYKNDILNEFQLAKKIKIEKKEIEKLCKELVGNNYIQKINDSYSITESGIKEYVNSSKKQDINSKVIQLSTGVKKVFSFIVKTVMVVSVIQLVFKILFQVNLLKIVFYDVGKYF
ncbi:hypothetical protein [Tenacibaculum agarivorans]|uniref:hypothetical protein n=1 Tax=Tenacibaculum agarivorans TaxID=1908389 RepID=UPI00094BB294|nr:hypothetical protein [Tenacibaculum agarivorans]